MQAPGQLGIEQTVGGGPDDQLVMMLRWLLVRCLVRALCWRSRGQPDSGVTRNHRLRPRGSGRRRAAPSAHAGYGARRVWVG